MVTVLAIWAVLATLVAVFFWWCWGDDNQHLSDAYRNLLTDFNKVCGQRDAAADACDKLRAMRARWEQVVKYMSTEPKGE
jgi:hypothetical protein